MKPILIIPCFNDNNLIEKLLSSISDKKNLDILVIDDGSSDEVVINNHLDSLTIVRNSQNKGKGYSLKKGFSYAINNGYTHAVTMDADLQHNPDFIPDFLKVPPNIPLVLGVRNFDESMPAHRKLSNRITSFIISKMTKQSILDSQSGFRRYKLDSVHFKKCRENGFQFESEILINIFRNKTAKLEHILIPTVYDNEKSSINNIVDTYKFIKLIIRKIFDR